MTLKKLACLIIVIPFVAFSQSWTQLTDFPGAARDDGADFVINNKAYCFTGVSGSCNGDGYVFDGASETWSTMASLPPGTERQYAAAFSHNSVGYIMGGINCSGTKLNDFWQYSPTTNSWTALPNFPGTGRYGTSNFIIKNKAYIIGGTLANGLLTNEVWEYNFTAAAWTQKNNLPLNAMHRGSAFAIDTTGYICYGIDNNNAFNHYVYVYNHLHDSWRRVWNLILPSRFYVGTAVCNKQACLYGGVDSLNTITNNYTLFNPIDSSLSNLTGIPTMARKGGMAFSINNIFYLTTGYSSSNVRIKETWKNTALVGLKEHSSNEVQLKLFPNPATDALHIELELSAMLKVTNNIVTLNNEAYQDIYIQILNPIGELVYQSTLSNQQSSINIKQLNNGIYFVKLTKGSALLYSHRFVKN